jgi:hypothetical protein
MKLTAEIVITLGTSQEELRLTPNEALELYRILADHFGDCIYDKTENNARVVVPWYENIPTDGVLCYIADYEGEVMEDCEEDSTEKRKVTSYNRSYGLFTANGPTGADKTFEWKYAIPVDPALRLPNGAITL